MRISDWSSDVCSSDLLSRPLISERMSRVISPSRPRMIRPSKKLFASDTGMAAISAMERSRHRNALETGLRRSPLQLEQVSTLPSYQALHEIGRASAWERVFRYVSISVAAENIKKT